MTVITNGHKFFYYSDSCYATEADGTITFTTAKPDEYTAEDVVVTYTQIDGKAETENYGKLTIGSYAPIDAGKVNTDVGYDTENGAMVNGVVLNGEAFGDIPKIVSVYKYNLTVSGVKYGWMILDASGEPYKVGIEYTDLADLVRASYDLKNNSTIKFYKDYNDYVYESLEFYYSNPTSSGIFVSTTFNIDLNGHTISVCPGNENSFVKLGHNMAILETAAPGTTFKDPDGNDVTEYVHIVSSSGTTAIKLLGEGSSYKEIGGRGAIYVYVDSSKPGAVVKNGTGRIFGGSGTANNALNGMTTNSHRYSLTLADGTVVRDGANDSSYFKTAAVNLIVGNKYDNVIKFYANNITQVENNAANAQIFNSYIEANGSTIVSVDNATFKIYDSTIRATRAKGQTFYGFFNSKSTVTAVCAYRCNFISDNVDGNALFNAGQLRYHGSNPGLILDNCNFYNVKIAAKSINTSWNSAQNYKSSQYCGPALETGEKYGDGTNNAVLTTDKTRILLTGTCTTNMPYGTQEGATAVNGKVADDGLYYPALTNRVNYNAKAVADMQVGYWNNTITDVRTGKSYEMTYVVSDSLEFVDVTFNYADTTETVKYAVGGTIKNDYKYTPTTSKVMACTHGWDKAFGTVSAADTYTYNVAYKPTIAVYQNLSLYSNFKYNLYIPVAANGVEDIKDYVSSIYLDGKQQTVEETATIGGTLYYVFTVEGIDSNKTADTISFEIALKDGNAIAEGTKTLSVLGYLETALKNTDATKKAAEYKLYQATLNYTKAAYDAFGGNSAAVVALWNTYCKDKLAIDDIDTTTGTGTVNGLNSAALNLVAAPAFRFTTLNANADITVTYSYNGKTVTKSTKAGTITLTPMGEGKYYFDIELRAYEFYKDITITVDGGEAGTYNLANYYNGLVEAGLLENDAQLDALVKALNTYARAAAAYNK